MPSTAYGDPPPRAKMTENVHENDPEDAPLRRVPLSPEAAARSARNIALWRSYLPADCVRTMIRMGWDQTT